MSAFKTTRENEPPMPDPPAYPGAPRWLKVSAIAVGVAALLLVILIHAGGGPSHHMLLIGGPDHHATQEGRR